MLQALPKMKSIVVSIFLLDVFWLMTMPIATVVTPTTYNEVKGTATYHVRTAYFTENAGQVADEDVRFYSSMKGMQIGFAERFMLLKVTDSLPRSSDHFPRAHEWPSVEPGAHRARGVLMRVTFEGAHAVKLEGRSELPHKSNYFIGSDPSGWRTGVHSFSEVVYVDLYDGIDLVYRWGKKGMKYEFLLRPGADLDRITLTYEGVEALSIDPAGNLVMHTVLGDLKDSAPYSYQGAKEEVLCDFVLRGPLSYGFDCEGWDSSRSLVIDPLVYSTFLGGTGWDAGISPSRTSIAVDSAGNAYVSGTTRSPDFPTTPGAFDVLLDGLSDVFVAKLDSTGSDLVYATFLGGDSFDVGSSITVDPEGHAYITGHTGSTDFPVTPGAFDTTYGGYSDFFVVKLNAAGNALIYSTYLGGDNDDIGRSIALDSLGNAYVTGYTISDDFPVTPGAFDTVRNGSTGSWNYWDGFVAKLDATGSALVYSTFLGGEYDDYGNSMTVDSFGNAYVTGYTTSNDFPTSQDAWDTVLNGSRDAFVVKLNAVGSNLVYGTYLGGMAWDNGISIAVDPNGDAYVTGYTESMDFPATPGAFDTSYNFGLADAFVAKLNATGGDLVYATFLGGSGYLHSGEIGTSIAVDSFGRAHVTGCTDSTDFPVTPNAFQTNHSGGYTDVFLTALNASGSAMDYSTFLGGSNGWDIGESIALDSSNNSYLIGTTESSDFPVTPGAFDTTLNSTDAFVAKLSLEEVNTPPTISSFTATTSPEATAVLFTVIASDAEGHFLTYSFDFDSDGFFDISGPNNTASYVWGDDYTGNATVRVSDGKLSTEATTAVFVYNVAPSVSFATIPSGDEGDTLTFQAHATDPGSDDLIFSWWGHCYGWKSMTYPNDPLNYPDPYPSPEINPRNITDIQSVVCGDDGIFQWNVQVEDDDGGIATLSGTFGVDNLPPSLTVSPPSFVQTDEGTTLTLDATASDSGSDDLTFMWKWDYGPTETHVYYNDRIGPDPPNSPEGTFPFTASDSSTSIYGDDCACTVTLRVEDDDDGIVAYTTTVEVQNVPPTASITNSGPIDEGQTVSIVVTASDPGSDDITLNIDFGDGTSQTVVFYNDGVGPDPDLSPGGVYPFSVVHSTTHTYGDNGNFTVTLTVEDDDGGITTQQTVVVVENVAPSIDSMQYYLNASFSFRIAGEKWHNVEIHLYEDGTEIGYADITRYPGSPNEQMADFGDISIDFSKTYSAVAYYTPEDDPVNGQIWGATPAWIIIQYDDGEERIHHTFNVRNEDTWIWVIDDFSPYFLGHNITFLATASDPGSDDLIFTWNWGDGNTTENTYYNDGIGPDPYPSPEVNPITVTDTAKHAYALAGAYTITLTVTDDDGGSATLALTLII